MSMVLIFKNSIGEIYVESSLIFSVKVADSRVKNTILYHLDKIFDLVVLNYESDGSLVFYTRDTMTLNDSYLLTQALDRVKGILKGYEKNRRIS